MEHCTERSSQKIWDPCTGKIRVDLASALRSPHEMNRKHREDLLPPEQPIATDSARLSPAPVRLVRYCDSR